MKITDLSALKSAAHNLQRTEPGSDACKAAQRAYAAANPAKRDHHKTIFLLGRVFGPGSGDNAKSQNYAIVSNGQEVRVYDSVAHALTSLHSLTPTQEQAIRDAADYSTVDLNAVA